jgi:glucosamine-6-phosphate deaminase
MMPDYLAVSADELIRNSSVRIRVKGDMASIAQDLAESMLAEIIHGEQSGRGATLIIPVGPVDHFPILAKMLNDRKTSCRNTVFINMDEYLTDDDQWIPLDHPLSFRGYMERAFYSLLLPEVAPPASHRIFPDPADPSAVASLIASRSGVNACFGGIGINGHVAFNEPPEPGQTVSNEEFAALPTRVLNLSRETCTINSVTVGGEMSVIPKRAITVGIKEILASKRLRFYCNRPWQSAVIRRALYGPLTSACPASFLRTHPDATVTIADYVATPPNIRLR